METLVYRNPRLFWLALLVVAALGASSLLTIGRQEDPSITNLFATVVAPFPGASPERVEALVTEKIEAELRLIPEIDTIASTSATGVSSVRIELSQFIGAERIEQVWSEIRDAVSTAAQEFPPGLPEPIFDNKRTGAYSAIVALTPREGVDDNPAILRRFADELSDRLRRVPQTQSVRTYGARSEEVRVTLDPARLATLNVSADIVAQAIAASDAKVRAGQMRGERTDLLIEIAGEIVDVDRIRAIPIATGPDGSVVRVSDVAQVERGLREPPESLAYSDGVAGVLVAARMENDRQIDTWMAGIKGALSAFERELPGGLEARLVFDQSTYTTQRLAELGLNLATGIALVVIVLFLTLGWRSALIVSLAIPLSGLIAITAMQRLGIPIHQMSVTGLIVALGLLVDAAIVTTDEVARRLRAGVPAPEAVGGSVRRLGIPLLASTVTTVLAFMPMAMLPGPAGDFVGSIAIAVIIMLFASLAVALTITPALAGWLLADRIGGEGGGNRGMLANGIRWPWLGRVFSASIGLSLRHKGLSILIGLSLPVAGFASFSTLTAQFFPGVDRDQFYVQVALPNGAAIRETERLALAADAIVSAEPGIVQVQWVIGESAPAFYYNMQADRDRAPSFAEALVTTTDPTTTNDIIPRLQKRLDQAIPGAQVLVRGLVQGPPVAAPLEMRLVGPDQAVLRSLGEEARSILSTLPMVTHTRANLVGGAPQLVFRLDEDKVRLAGLDLAGAARQLEATLEGATGGSLLEGTEELPVRVRVGDAMRADLRQIAGLDLIGPGPASERYGGIPLSALGEWRIEPSQSPIERRNGERLNIVQAYLTHGVLPEEALQLLQARLAEGALVLPEGYRLEFGGDSDARAETISNLISTLGLVVTLTLVTIVLTFMSFRLALIATIVCGLSMGLSFLALAVLQFPFGVQALIGSIGSIGVSINAAIIIMTALQEDEGAMAGDLEAMRKVVVRSSRHIFSTTITTVGGFLPLILAGGGFWPPFAVAIAGGVLLSSIVSFYFTPPMFALLMRGRKQAVGMGQGISAPQPVAA